MKQNLNGVEYALMVYWWLVTFKFSYFFEYILNWNGQVDNPVIKSRHVWKCTFWHPHSLIRVYVFRMKKLRLAPFSSDYFFRVILFDNPLK